MFPHRHSTSPLTRSVTRRPLARANQASRAEISSGSLGALIFGVALLVFSLGGGYIYSVNASAVQGYEIRRIEQRLSELKQRNAQLRLAEAEARELSRITEASDELRMERVSQISTLTYPGTIAYR